MEIKLLEVAGLMPAYRALHLPFGKGLCSNRDKDNELSRIELDDIISIQFADKAALVGMK